MAKGIENATFSINWMEANSELNLIYAADEDRVYVNDPYVDELDVDYNKSYWFAIAERDMDYRIRIKCRDTGEIFEPGKQIKRSLLRSIINDRNKHGWGLTVGEEILRPTEEDKNNG